MASSFTWLDYSEHERRKMLDVISLFRERDTRDELGIGTVRDAFADMLFPGTSTIQRRARYFMFVPWMYLELEQRRIPSSQIAIRARQEEIALINVLAKSDDTEGVIGIDARASLQRLPSNIYWQGLGVWGIRLFPGSQDEYHRSLDKFYALARQTLRNDDKEPVNGKLARNWHSGLPPKPDDFPQQASFELTAVEADYCRERIISHAPGTLLAFLVDQGRPHKWVAFPWEHPQISHCPPRIQEQLEHARNFSEAIHGAALLYNLILAEQTESQEQIEFYQREISKWCVNLRSCRPTLQSWNRPRFWEIAVSDGARIPRLTRTFVDAWLGRALSFPTGRQFIADEQARRLVHERERFLKRGLARLDNPRARELWSGAAGAGRLTFRWEIAQTLVSDILAGFGYARPKS